MRLIIATFLLLMVGNLSGQEDNTLKYLTKDYFTPPVDHTIKLAGSFGELRSNHFHSGIDIKSSRGGVGDTLRSVADGYVSRIKLQRGGYGKALYIDHPNGYTSVYGHMNTFSPEIEAYVREQQRLAQSYELDIYPQADKLPVTQRGYIGKMGNTGRSYGPHLHFEIRKTDSETPQNPYLHGIGPSDGKPPLLYAVGVHGLDQDKHPIYSDVKNINGKAGVYGPSHHFVVPAWRAGFMLQTFDQMDGSSNKNGLYELKMYVDDSLHYKMIIDSVKWDHTKYINSFIAYEEKKNNNRTMIKCYRPTSNQLELYESLQDDGYLKLYKDKPRAIRFEARDYFGNLSVYECTVSRRDQKPADVPSTTFNRKIYSDQSYNFNIGNVSCNIPQGMTDNVLLLKYGFGEGGGYQIGEKDQPIFKSMRLAVPITHLTETQREKVVLIYTSTNTPTSFGGDIVGDSLVTYSDRLGDYALHIDNVPPTITPLEVNQAAKNKGRFIFRIKDDLGTRGSKVRSMEYAVYIDDVWTICPLKALGDLLTIPLKGLKKGSHTLRIVCKDHSGNEKVYEKPFTL